jgi:Zn-dependent protease
MNNLGDNLQFLPYLLPAFIIGAVLHELAHAVVATRLGDPTPREQGRLTLNPLVHLDPLGSAMFLITFLFFSFPFGWARPVITMPGNFRSPKRDMAVVAIAGPITNLVIAIVGAAVLVQWDPDPGSVWSRVLYLIVQVNVVLSIFNMLPIPPLDGSRVIGAFMPQQMYRDWMSLDQYAPIMFLLLFLVFGAQVSALVGDGTDVVMRGIVRLVT